jgi:hypothetical protein
VRLEIRIVFELCVQAVNLADLPSRMFVASGAAFLQRDLDEGAAQQNRGRRTGEAALEAKRHELRVEADSLVKLLDNVTSQTVQDQSAHR